MLSSSMIRSTPFLLSFGFLAGLLSHLRAGTGDPWELSFPVRHVIGAPDRPPYDTNVQARLLDLNGDGVVDYYLRVSGIAWKIQAAERNRLAAVLKPPPDIGSIVASFEEREPIGNELSAGVDWLDRNTPNQSAPGESTINACVVTSDLVCIGLFRVVAYLGVHFKAEDGEMHYGWVRINANGVPGGIVLDWAYDTRPGIPIRAGAMPGEGMLALQPPVVCDDVLWLTVSGQLGKQVILEMSEDFGDWRAVLTNVSPFQTVLFLGAEPPRAFFRAVETE